MLFRDIRELSDALIGESDWQRAIEGYAERRREYFGVLRAFDLWKTLIERTDGPEGERRREANERAREADPTLGAWALIQGLGPDGLVPDEASRRHFFGEDL
jgi:hypothetical protein